MKYKITLNGKVYEVEVEQGRAQVLGVLDAQPAAAPVAAPAAPIAAPAAAPVSAPAAAPVSAPAPTSVPAPAGGTGEAVPAPMPGTIVDIRVAAGDAVKQGQTLVVLEAMKMENDIVSPRDGVVTKFDVAKGETVSAGAPLVWIA